jgi:hypothetical protein
MMDEEMAVYDTFSDLGHFVLMAMISMVLISTAENICEIAGGVSGSSPPHIIVIIMILCAGFGGCVGNMSFMLCRWLARLTGRWTE